MQFLPWIFKYYKFAIIDTLFPQGKRNQFYLFIFQRWLDPNKPIRKQLKSEHTYLLDILKVYFLKVKD